jgi:hypothetical protein
MFNRKSNLIKEIHCKIVVALQPYSETTKAGGKCYCSTLQQAEHLVCYHPAKDVAHAYEPHTLADIEGL